MSSPPPILSWSLHTLTGARLGVLEGVLPGSWVDMEAKGRRTASLKLSTDDPCANDIYPLGVVLRAWLDGEPIFAGPLLQPTVDFADGTIEVPAIGPRYRLESFQVGMRGAGGEGLNAHAPDAPYRWEQMPQGHMLRRLVEYADPTDDERAIGIPTHGIIAGRVDPGVLRDREYEGGKQIAEAMDELADVAGGPDWDLVPMWSKSDPQQLARLEVLDVAGVPLGDESLRLDFGIGADNASALKWMPGGDTGGPVVNRMFGVGEAPEYDGEAAEAPVPPTFLGNQIDSQLAFGIYSRYEGQSGVTDQPTVAGKVAAVLATNAFPVDHFEVTPRPNVLRFTPTGDLWLGDWFSARGQRDRVVVNLGGRVSGGRIAVIDETGATQTTIRAAPRENHSVST